MKMLFSGQFWFVVDVSVRITIPPKLSPVRAARNVRYDKKHI